MIIASNITDMEFDVEYEVERRFILFLRHLFENDPVFKYNDNESETLIKITTEYPEISDAPLHIPHVIITGVVAQTDPSLTFHGNFLRDVRDDEGFMKYEEHMYLWNYSLNFSCWADNISVCKTLSMKLAQAISMTEYLDTAELNNLHIVGNVVRSPVGMYQQHPNKVFSGSLNFQGQMSVLNRRKQATTFTGGMDEVILRDIVLKRPQIKNDKKKEVFR